LLPRIGVEKAEEGTETAVRHGVQPELEEWSEGRHILCSIAENAGATLAHGGPEEKLQIGNEGENRDEFPKSVIPLHLRGFERCENRRGMRQGCGKLGYGPPQFRLEPTTGRRILRHSLALIA
jgi:hypothetical protein